MSTKKVKPMVNRKAQEKSEHLQVFVRCRPLSSTEQNQRSHASVDLLGPSQVAVQDTNSKISKTFSFDKVFGPASSQNDVYKSVVEPLISDVLSGFNCTVFAYGQTGSGKTYTMEGEVTANKLTSEESTAGIIPRAMCALFDELHVLQSEYTVRISFMEIYNEDIYDLLSPDEVPPKLRLFDDSTRKGSVIIQGLQEVMVHTLTQVLEEVRKGCAKRQTAATLLNAHSSRSHSIFCVTVHTKENSVDGEELLKTGKLYLVDLAGSENIARSGAVDKRAREACNINQSLLTLSRVITCLIDRHPHIPYRESKLTRILQDSLGGRTKTSMIATISPTLANVEETLSTLDYAQRAKSVTNKPQVNQKVSQKVVMKEYMDVIEDLKKKLEIHRNGSGVYLNDANYQQLIQQTRERNKFMSDKIAEIRTVHQKMKSIEETFTSLSTNLESNKLNLENADKTIQKTAEEICVASKTLSKVVNEKEEVGNLLTQVENHENELRNQAELLIEVVDASHSDSCKIHNRLDQSSVVLQNNRALFERLKEEVEVLKNSVSRMWSNISRAQTVLEKLESDTVTFASEASNDMGALKEVIQTLKARSEDCLGRFRVNVNNLVDLSKRFAHDATVDVINGVAQIRNDLQHIDQTLTSLSAEYHQTVLALPQRSNSLVKFLDQSTVSIKNAVLLQMNNVSTKLSSVHSESRKIVHNYNSLIGSFLECEENPYNEVMNNAMRLNNKISAVEEICLNEEENLNKHVVNLLASKEKSLHDIDVIKESRLNSTNTLEQLKDEMPSVCKAVVDVLNTHIQPCVLEVQDGTQMMKEIVENSLCIVNKAEEVANQFILKDDHVLLQQILDSTKNEHVKNTCLTAVSDWSEATAEMSRSLPPILERYKQNVQTYKQKKDEVFEEFVRKISETNAEIQLTLNGRVASIKDVVHSELSHDVPTGHTPIKKSGVTIPELTSLPSPVMKVVKTRVQNTIATQKRYPRKLRAYSASLVQDYDEDCMASDPEASSPKRVPVSYGLKKASSFSDLRSDAVFHRPRIPKKYVRKAVNSKKFPSTAM